MKPVLYIDDDDDELDNVRVMGLDLGTAPLSNRQGIGREHNALPNTDRPVVRESAENVDQHSELSHPKVVELSIRDLAQPTSRPVVVQKGERPTLLGDDDQEMEEEFSDEYDSQFHSNTYQAMNVPLQHMSLDQAYQEVHKPHAENVSKMKEMAAGAQGTNYEVPGRASVFERVLELRARKMRDQRVIAAVTDAIEEDGQGELRREDSLQVPQQEGLTGTAHNSFRSVTEELANDSPTGNSLGSEEGDSSSDDYDADWDASDSDSELSYPRGSNRGQRSSSSRGESFRIPPLSLQGGGGIGHSPGPFEAILEKELTRPLARSLVKSRIGVYSILYLIGILSVLCFSLAITLAASFMFRETADVLSDVADNSFPYDKAVTKGYSTFMKIFAWPAFLLMRYPSRSWIIDWFLPILLVLGLFVLLTLRSVLRTVAAGHISFFSAQPAQPAQPQSHSAESSESGDQSDVGETAHTRVMTIGTGTGLGVVGDSNGLTSHSTPQQSRVHVEAALNLGMSIILTTHLATPMIVYAPFLASYSFARIFVSLIFPYLGISIVCSTLTRTLNPALRLAPPFFSPFVAGLVSMLFIFATGLIHVEAVQGVKESALAISLLGGGLLFGCMLELFHNLTQFEVTMDEIYASLVNAEAQNCRSNPPKVPISSELHEERMSLADACMFVLTQKSFWLSLVKLPSRPFSVDSWSLRDFQSIRTGDELTNVQSNTQSSVEESDNYGITQEPVNYEIIVLPASTIYNRIVKNWAEIAMQTAFPLFVLALINIILPWIAAIVSRERAIKASVLALSHGSEWAATLKPKLWALMQKLYPNYEEWIWVILDVKSHATLTQNDFLNGIAPILSSNEMLFTTALIPFISLTFAFLVVAVLGSNLLLIGTFSADLEQQERSSDLLNSHQSTQEVSDEQTIPREEESGKSDEDIKERIQSESRENSIKSRLKQPPSVLAKCWWLLCMFQFVCLIVAFSVNNLFIAWVVSFSLPVFVCGWALPRRGLRLYSRMFFE